MNADGLSCLMSALQSRRQLHNLTAKKSTVYRLRVCLENRSQIRPSGDFASLGLGARLRNFEYAVQQPV